MPLNSKRFRILILFLLVILPYLAQSQSTAPKDFENPIISGYHPDPSICRVGDDYYLVNSTFIWYPGIPIYHSKDLVNWELIGHGIDRPDMLDFEGLQDRAGVYAVTIRHHEGKFYLITTCVACDNNFYITADNPAGPWSDPIWLNDAPGIDPSLMWDDDGKCYYVGHSQMEDPDWIYQMGMWLQELDTEEGKLVGKREILSHGHANNAMWTEGPHLYKINGKYMLMVSEGGTGEFHALTVHHSDSLWGPYVSDYINPVMTHRHLGKDYPIQAIGHGDLVQTQNGEWWCVSLGKRLVEGKVLLARETFLMKVEFEGQTPIFNPGHGKVLEKQKRPDLPWTPVKEVEARDSFNGDELGLIWNFIRVPKENFYNLRRGNLEIKLRPQIAQDLTNSSMIIRRIQDHKFSAQTELKFSTSKANEQAGMVIYRTFENHYLFMKEKESLVVYKVFKNEKTEVSRLPYSKSTVVLKAEGDNLDLTFSYGESEDDLKQIGEKQSLIVTADGNGNMFNGPGIGMYGTSNGKKSKSVAKYNYFEYKAE